MVVICDQYFRGALLYIQFFHLFGSNASNHSMPKKCDCNVLVNGPDGNVDAAQQTGWLFPYFFHFLIQRKLHDADFQLVHEKMARSYLRAWQIDAL